jgi:NADH-quinone oxidoreductase subunit G
MSAATATGIGADDGDVVSVSTGRGAVSLPLVITDMPDGVAWLPLNSPGSAVHEQLAVTTGAVVQIEREATA